MQYDVMLLIFVYYNDSPFDMKQQWSFLSLVANVMKIVGFLVKWFSLYICVAL
jgi:hypothetical protein